MEITLEEIAAKTELIVKVGEIKSWQSKKMGVNDKISYKTNAVDLIKTLLV